MCIIKAMKVVADLHLHSKYSRAVSQHMDLENMEKWADIKGIDLVGTGDFTHPLWAKEMEAKLTEKNQGIYKLKNSSSKASFILTAEISAIFSQGGKGRRIHLVVIAPSLESAKKINEGLTAKGVNLFSDGRPIVGMSAQGLSETIWSASKDSIIIPAHVWTPWFSLYGSNSGFDSIAECFGPLASRITAVETGLSSDPAMNWRIAELDKRTILSFSDAHSPAKLGREATVFNLNQNFDFGDLDRAIKNNDLAYTIEFYPQEGKYHYSGHRKCQVVQSPSLTGKNGTLCPVCGKPLTLGVMHRVEKLASGRNIEIAKKENASGLVGIYNQTTTRPPYVMLVPLLEIVAQSIGSSTASAKTMDLYLALTKKFGTEIQILTNTPIEKIEQFGEKKLALAITKVRSGQISISPGYDGVFGVVSIFQNPINQEKEQMSLF